MSVRPSLPHFVCEHVACPNCSRKLGLLPESYPLFDVQCEACLFRAQVKTSSRKPGKTIRGAGWSIMEATLKAGGSVPPLLAVYAWESEGQDRRTVRFYPFVPSSHLEDRQLSKDPAHPRANYRMFEYRRMNELPYFPLLDV